MTKEQLEHLTPAERDLHARGLADLPASTRVVLEPLRTVAELRAERDALRARVAALEGAIRQARADLNSVNAVDPADELGAIQNDLDAALAARPEVKA